MKWAFYRKGGAAMTVEANHYFRGQQRGREPQPVAQFHVNLMLVYRPLESSIILDSNMSQYNFISAPC